GAILNNTNLHGVILDKANLGCTPTASGSDGTNLGCPPTTGGYVCTQMIEANLNKASLKRATLAHTSLQGADLTSVNLDGANLFAANLNKPSDPQVSATLQGAFLRNVNLATAELTGADLSNSNFYSTVTVSTCNPAPACGFLTNCASAVNATLNNAVFSGA